MVGGGALVADAGAFLATAAASGAVAEVGGAPETVGWDLFLLPPTIEVFGRGIGVAIFGGGVALGGFVLIGILWTAAAVMAGVAGLSLLLLIRNP